MTNAESISEAPRGIAIIGTVGVPGCYGGFETLAENLVSYHARSGCSSGLTVWCSSKDMDDCPDRHESAELRYVGFRANGIQSIPYDVLSLWDAIRTRHDCIVLLGVSGAMALPLVRLFSRVRVVTNIDGIEWKREKWSVVARAVLRASEWAAVHFSHDVIADNQAIAEYVREAYGSECHVITYGGDHALETEPVVNPELNLPAAYTLGLCRIEPENNIAMILEAFAQMPDRPLVFVGNWDKSEYGRELRSRYRQHGNIYLVDPIYDAGRLRWIRNGAQAYVHGHSAGGTNPSLVEMMHFGIPVFSHGCDFNRYTTDNRAVYFESSKKLKSEVEGLTNVRANEIGQSMREIAQNRYTWEHVGRAYFELIRN